MKELNTFREFLNENEDEGKTISLYPFYNEELAQKLFAIGIKDGNDWDDFLVKKLGGLWNGDPESDGTMMYNVKEPLYSDLKNKIKVLLKQIMAGTVDNDVEEQINENEVEPQTDLIGIAARTLKDMSAEEAIDAIDRLMLYLKDAKADIEYKNQ